MRENFQKMVNLSYTGLGISFWYVFDMETCLEDTQHESLKTFKMSEKFCLKWNDFYTNVSKSFSTFRNEEYLHDVTLVSDDHTKVPAHKLVLSACSEFFRDIFKNNPNSHPLICLDGISSDDLKNIMDYIYNGEVNIYQENLDGFLNVAQRLKLEGLIAGETENDAENENPSIEDFNNEFEKFDTVSHSNQTFKFGNKETKKKREAFAGTIAITSSSEDKDGINEQVNQYLEKNPDGGYICKVCGNTSNKKYNMMNHIETHMEGMSYSCPICQKTFRSKNSLSSHKSQTHK